ncbi:hypothetical protein [Cryobacterium sp. TMT4-10]|uniref:hypothetical protein n=2 Tax=unclassified Cryobacterium TaxID=2649013 RepID=UPI0010697C8C|nr:hypothetical protein [Cryobacterium sp. TMT4-10]TFD13127.1 hypothetical protein E3T42_14230 [Cryobacterium sp. TMT4-10]
MERYRIDRETSMPWVEVAHSARIMREVLDTIGTPLRGSAFAQVDAQYQWEAASDWARDYLSAGIEHLEFWADLTAPLKFHPEAVVLHKLRPVQALARAAVESASQAVWMMDAKDAHSTALRHLCLILDDLEEERKALPPSEKHRMHAARAQLLERVASTTSEEEIGRFRGYMAVVKEASAAAARNGSRTGGISDPAEVERLWRSSAGTAHGKRWPLVALQISVAAGNSDSGRVQRATMPDPQAITKILKLADAVVTYGVVRFATHSGYEPQLGQILREATERLLTVIPRIDDEDADTANG